MKILKTKISPSFWDEIFKESNCLFKFKYTSVQLIISAIHMKLKKFLRFQPCEIILHFHAIRVRLFNLERMRLSCDINSSNKKNLRRSEGEYNNQSVNYLTIKNLNRLIISLFYYKKYEIKI